MSSPFQKPPFNYVYQVGLANAIDYNDNEIVVNGVAPETLVHVLTIPGQVLVNRGQRLDVVALGRQTGAAATKTLRLRLSQGGAPLGGAEIYLNSFINGSNFPAWGFLASLFRQENSLIGICDMKSALQLGAVNPSAIGTETTYFENTPDFSLPIVLAFSIEIGGAETMSQKMSQVFVI